MPLPNTAQVILVTETSKLKLNMSQYLDIKLIKMVVLYCRFNNVDTTELGDCSFTVWQKK